MSTSKSSNSQSAKILRRDMCEPRPVKSSYSSQLRKTWGTDERQTYTYVRIHTIQSTTRKTKTLFDACFREICSKLRWLLYFSEQEDDDAKGYAKKCFQVLVFCSLLTESFSIESLESPISSSQTTT